jgi:restriction system protein
MNPSPDYQSLMLPLLGLCVEGTVTFRASVQALGDQFGLTSEQMTQKLQSGQAVIYNRAGCAKSELVKAGFSQHRQRGLVEITDRGRAVLAQSTVVAVSCPFQSRQAVDNRSAPLDTTCPG